MRKNAVLLLLLLIVPFTNVMANPDYEKIWSYFTVSKYDDALQEIQTALVENPKDVVLLDMGLQLLKQKNNYAAAISQMTKIIEAAPNPNPYIQSNYDLFSFSAVSSPDEDLLERFLVEVLDNPKLDATISASLRDELGNYYLARHSRSKAEKVFRQIGSVSEWSLLSPFENLMGNGFDKYKNVIDKPQGTTFTGYYNARISWYPLKYHIPGRWIHLDQYCFSPRSIVFAQTYCNSTADQDVYLRIGISGSLKVYVNDAIVLSEAQEINNGIDALSVKVHLNKGSNRIVVQLGNSDRNGKVNFNLRLTDESSNVVPTLTYSADYSAYQKATLTQMPARIKVPYLQYFIDEADKKGVFEYYFNFKAGQIAAHNENLDFLEEIGSKLIEKYPDCGEFYSSMLNYYSRTGNRTMSSEIYEKIKKLKPNSVTSVATKISEAFEKENYADASNLIASNKEIIGMESYYTYRISLLVKQKKTEDLYKVIDESYRMYPDNAVFVELKASLESSEKKDAAAAMSVLQDYLEKHYNMKLSRQYFYMVANSRPAKALDFLKELVNDHNYEVGPLYFALSVYDNQYYIKQRMSLISQLLEFAPNNSNLHYRRAQAKMGASDEEAQQELTLALENYPYNFDALALQRTIDNKPNVFDLFQNPDYEKLFADAQAKADNKSELEIILEEDQMVIYSGGAMEFRRVNMMKSNNEKGVDRIKEFNLPVYNNQELTIEKAEVLKINGNKLKGEINENKIVFTNLEKGDAVLVIYRYKEYPIVGLYNQILHTFPFNRFNFSHRRKITILAHPSFKFNYKSNGFDHKPEISKVDDFDSFVWEQANVERIEDEVSMPDYWDVGKYITISSIPDWKFINNWYQILSNTSTENTRLIDKTINKIFPNGKSANAMENALKIYEYIVKNVRYSSVWFRNSGLIPQNVTQTLSSKLGDCKDVALTFKTLADRVGIKSNLILVNTKDNGTMHFGLPSIEFNHCMVKMNIDNKDYFLELTSDVNGFHTINSTTLNSCYLEIGENSSNAIERISPQTRVKNSTYRTCSMNFDSDKLLVKKDVLYVGDIASDKKSRIRNAELKEQEKSVVATLPNIYSNQQLIRFDFNKEQLHSALSDSLLHTFDYEVYSPFTKVANLLVFKIPFSFNKAGLSILQSKERSTDLCLWNSPLDLDYEYEQVEINLPQGKKLTETPPPLQISNKYFDFTLAFTKSVNKCIATKECKYKTLDVPAAEYNDFKNAMMKVVDAESIQLALQDGVDEPEPKTVEKVKKGKK